MEYTYTNLFYTARMIEDHKLADILEDGWELVSMVPFRMQPENGGTVVQEYLVTLRQLKHPGDQVVIESFGNGDIPEDF